MTDKGAYLIVSSVRGDFAEQGNRLHALNVLLTDLVIVSQRADRGYEITARSGTSGSALDDVLVEIANSQEARLRRMVDVFVRMFEPVMLLVMAAVFVFIALGLILPIFNYGTLAQ